MLPPVSGGATGSDDSAGPAPAPGRPAGPRPTPGRAPAAPVGPPSEVPSGAPPGPRRPPRPPRSGGVRFREAVPTAATAVVDPSVPPPAAPSPAAVATIEPGVEPHETHTGRIRRLRHREPHDELLPQIPSNASGFRRRYGVVYDTQGPKVRLGVLWAIAVVASLAPQVLRPWGFAVLYGVVAGAAAAQVIDAHRISHRAMDRIVAALAGSALPVAAISGTRALGLGYLGLVGAALVAAFATREAGRLPLARAGHIIEAAGICGGAAASLVLLAQYEIGALILLLCFVMAYDASDYVVGSGASNGIEGPLAGAFFIAAIAAIAAELRVPPFRGPDVWSFAVLAMIACPAGQILASAMLPAANSRAPALRRLDSMLIVAPAWAGLVGLYLTRAG